jgi:hypothetical protein
MNATQTYVNIAPTAASLRFMPLTEFQAPNAANYTTRLF